MKESLQRRSGPKDEVIKEGRKLADVTDVVVPDIGGADNVDVIEVAVKVGDTVAKEDPLITLESDKASMDIPAPFAGEVAEIKVKVGDKISEGGLILKLKSAQAAPAPAKETKKAEKPAAAKATKSAAPETKPTPETATATTASSDVYAGPGVRRLAREQDVNLDLVSGSGRKGRIVKEDVENFVKSHGVGGAAMPAGIAPPPQVDFTKFGEIEVQPLSRIKKLSGANLQRNWVTVPHVTQFDEADITELENFRQQQKVFAEKQGVRLTPLVFIMKAVVAALKDYPLFNASLDPSGENLVMKKYFHIGVAVDTPNGLVVPVIRDVDQKGCLALAQELGEVSLKAREKKLGPSDMQGGCFTISSLGGIGGTAFTPIVNMPEVAILGVSRSQIKPIYIDGEFVPRLMLPLSLSYDHRVIDGADAARFSQLLVGYLSDIRKVIL